MPSRNNYNINFTHKQELRVELTLNQKCDMLNEAKMHGFQLFKYTLI